MFFHIKSICLLPNKFKLKIFNNWKEVFSLEEFQNYQLEWSVSNFFKDIQLGFI